MTLWHILILITENSSILTCIIYSFINGLYTLFWKILISVTVYIFLTDVFVCFFYVALPMSSSFSSSPLGFSATPMNKTPSLLDLGSSRSGTSTHGLQSIYNLFNVYIKLSAHKVTCVLMSTAQTLPPPYLWPATLLRAALLIGPSHRHHGSNTDSSLTAWTSK